MDDGVGRFNSERREKREGCLKSEWIEGIEARTRADELELFCNMRFRGPAPPAA